MYIYLPCTQVSIYGVHNIDRALYILCIPGLIPVVINYSCRFSSPGLLSQSQVKQFPAARRRRQCWPRGKGLSPVFLCTGSKRRVVDGQWWWESFRFETTKLKSAQVLLAHLGEIGMNPWSLKRLYNKIRNMQSVNLVQSNHQLELDADRSRQCHLEVWKKRVANTNCR